MQQQDGIARALVEVVHAQPVLLEIVRLEVEAGEVGEALVGRAVGVDHATLLVVRRQLEHDALGAAHGSSERT